jgi:hypothetical protein
MARSFYYGSDDELAIKSKFFAEQILSSPSDYGLTLEQCQEYAALDAAYQVAYQAAATPFTRTSGQVQARRDARAALMKMAANLVRIISGTPSVTSEQKVYLGISIPGQGGPVGAPGEPTNFRFTLDAIGAVRLRWQCNNPRGAIRTMYQIWRQIDGRGFEFLGVSGKRRFIDMTIPPGSAQVTYRVRGIRSTGNGPSNDFNVNFGTGLAMKDLARMSGIAA